MPTRLITPRDSSAENDEGDAWGISAVGAAGSHYSGTMSKSRFSTLESILAIPHLTESISPTRISLAEAAMMRAGTARIAAERSSDAMLTAAGLE